MDGNVRRVLTRLLAFEGDLALKPGDLGVTIADGTLAVGGAKRAIERIHENPSHHLNHAQAQALADDVGLAHAHLAQPLRSLVQGRGAANLNAPAPANDLNPLTAGERALTADEAAAALETARARMDKTAPRDSKVL